MWSCIYSSNYRQSHWFRIRHCITYFSRHVEIYPLVPRILDLMMSNCAYYLMNVSTIHLNESQNVFLLNTRDYRMNTSSTPCSTHVHPLTYIQSLNPGTFWSMFFLAWEATNNMKSLHFHFISLMVSASSTMLDTLVWILHIFVFGNKHSDLTNVWYVLRDFR